MELTVKDFKEMGLDIFRPELDGVKILFNSEGQTTRKNLKWIWGETRYKLFFSELSYFLPSEILDYFPIDDLKNKINEEINQKHDDVLNWLKKSDDYWRDGGDIVEKDEENIKDWFNWNYSLKTFKSKLSKRSFSSEGINH